MEPLSIRQIRDWTNGRYEGPDFPVAGVSVDSRSAARGELFFALRGERHDGHDYLGEAFASGAAAAVVERRDLYDEHRRLGRHLLLVPDARAALGDVARGYRASLGLVVVGITGTNGKTTTKEMLGVILGAGTAISPKSFNNDVGVPLTLLNASRHDRVCVVEMGTNAPGEIAALAGIARPDLGVVQNVGEGHLEGLGDLEGVAREKGALVEALGPKGCAILNHDDPRTRAMARRSKGYVLTFGSTPQADVFGGGIRATSRGVSFLFLNRRRVRMQLLGAHNVSNALAAASVALWLGRDPNDVCDRLERYRGVPMRLALETVGQVRLIQDCYNANPRSVEAAIAELVRTASGRRILVLGDMLELGRRSGEYHEAVGRRAARAGVEILWAIGPQAEAAARAAREAGLPEVHWSPDAASAAGVLPFAPRSRDRILFKASRGMRLEAVYDAVRETVRARAAAAQEARAPEAPSIARPTGSPKEIQPA